MQAGIEGRNYSGGVGGLCQRQLDKKNKNDLCRCGKGAVRDVLNQTEGKGEKWGIGEVSENKIFPGAKRVARAGSRKTQKKKKNVFGRGHAGPVNGREKTKKKEKKQERWHKKQEGGLNCAQGGGGG